MYWYMSTIASCPEKDTDDYIETIDELLKIKKLGKLTKYNGNDYELNMENNEIQMIQQKIIESMVKEVEIKSKKIPGFPNVTQKKNNINTPVKLDDHRRLVGKMLYMCNKSRHDLSLIHI